MRLLWFVEKFVSAIGLAVSLLYFYQVIYLVIGLLKKKKTGRERPAALRRYAALISARNEEEVIGELIGSLRRQDYPSGLLDIYVVADNCTDGTAQAAQSCGATVFRRFNRREVGKGYALDFLLKKIAESGKAGAYAGYFIFDADNLVDPAFVSEMNRTFDSGRYAAVTGYRNSKNFGQNWITAGYSIWFLREARFVNSARMALGTTCHVSGTGFLLSADVVREAGGWPWHLMTEDLELSARLAAQGKRVGYCEGAVIYDEQPTSFRQSWDQRLRWSKGFYQVDGKYGVPLLKGMLRGGRYGLGCYDILMTVTPGVLFTAALALFQGAVLLGCLLSPETAVVDRLLYMSWDFLRSTLLSYYAGMLLYGLLTVACEWRAIRAKTWQKLIYLPAFPIFMLTYLPITVAALFQKVEWKPIRHRSAAQMDRAA